jgi:archaeal type IV pilus assembly protein PilA
MMVPRSQNNTSAVSPVVGVMLMLVVTIIIAAVVSAFAGGLGGSQVKTPQASLVATDLTVVGAVNSGGSMGQGVPAPNVPAGHVASDIYLTFEHKGGDAFNLANVELKLSSLQKPAEGTTISNAKAPADNNAEAIVKYGVTGIGDKSLISGFSYGWTKYMERLPDHGSIIKTGDKFVVHADYAGLYNGVSSVDWLGQNATYPFFVNTGDVLTYQFIDKPSGRQITSGQIAVPEFTVSAT